MSAFATKKFVTQREREAFNRSMRGRYLKALNKHSFLLFGLPFMTILFGASYYLSYFTQIRYDQHDKRVTQMGEEEAFNVFNNKRQVDMKEEYYRLQKMDLDSWEQKRVPRLAGESENKWSKSG